MDDMTDGRYGEHPIPQWDQDDAGQQVNDIIMHEMQQEMEQQWKDALDAIVRHAIVANERGQYRAWSELMAAARTLADGLNITWQPKW